MPLSFFSTISDAFTQLRTWISSIDKTIKTLGILIGVITSIYVAADKANEWFQGYIRTIIIAAISDSNNTEIENPVIGILSSLKGENRDKFVSLLKTVIESDLHISLATKNEAYLLILVKNKNKEKAANKPKDLDTFRTEIYKELNIYNGQVDSGYTYYFKFGVNNQLDRHEFLFYADPNTQRVICYLVHADRRLLVGDDVEIRIDGSEFNFDGELIGKDITSALKDDPDLEGDATKIHKLAINTPKHKVLK